MSYGCAKMPRGIRRFKAWKKKPFSERSSLVDLFLDVTFSRGRIVEGVRLKRGQLFIKKKELARRWGWDVRKVRRFLKKLEAAKGEPWEIKQEIIRANAANPDDRSYEIGTRLTFLNYDLICESEGEDIGEI